MLDEFEKYIRYTRSVSEYTAANYMHYVTRYEKFMRERGKDILDSDYNDVGDFLMYLNKSGLANSSVGNFINGLRTLYAWLAFTHKKQNLYDVNLYLRDMVKVHKEKNLQFVPKNEDIQRLQQTLEDYQRLLSFDKEHESYKRVVRDKAAIYLLNASGIRSKEVRTLRRMDIEMESKTFIVKKGKGDKQRQAYFNEKTSEALLEHFEVNCIKDEDLVFPFANAGSLCRMVKSWNKKAKVSKKCTPHAFRREFVSKVFDRFGSDVLAADFAGHSDINTTRKHYIHHADGYLKEKYDELQSEK